MRKASQGSTVSTVGILICKWTPKMRKASQGSPVCMVGMLICKWIPKMRTASQESLVCTVGIRFVDPKNEESFSRKSCMYGWDLICGSQK